MTNSETKDRIQKLLKVTSAIWTVFYGLLSYLRLALQLFWEEYGDQIHVGIAVFVLFVFELTGKTYTFGRKFRKDFDLWLSKRLDSAFFQLIDIQ